MGTKHHHQLDYEQQQDIYSNRKESFSIEMETTTSNHESFSFSSSSSSPRHRHRHRRRQSRDFGAQSNSMGIAKIGSKGKRRNILIDDESFEEQEIYFASNTTLARVIKTIIELHMKVASLKLCYGRHQEREPVKNVAKFLLYNSGSKHRKINNNSIKMEEEEEFCEMRKKEEQQQQHKSSSWKLSKLFTLIHVIFFTLAVAKWLTLAILQLIDDYLLVSLQPIVIENTTTTTAQASDKCAFKEDIHLISRFYLNQQLQFHLQSIEQEINWQPQSYSIQQQNEDNSLIEWLRQVNNWLYVLGNPLISITGSGGFLFAIMGVFTFCDFFLPMIYTHFYELKSDHLNFLFNPIGERKRVKRNLNFIQDEIIKSAKTFGSISNLNCKQIGLMVMPIRKHANKSKGKSYVELIENENLSKLVQPICINPDRHKSLLYYYGIGLISMTICSVINCVTIASFSFVNEIFLRVTHRLSQLECLLWNPKAVPITYYQYDYLEPLLSKEDQEAYLNFDGSIENWHHLAMMIERKNFFTFDSCMFIFQAGITYTLIAMAGSFHLNLFVLNFLDKSSWLAQIDQQIVSCSLMLNELKLLITYKERKIDVFSDGNENKSIENFDGKLAKFITVTFANYELFRQQQHSYQRFSNFQLKRLVFIGIGLWTFGYIAISYSGISESSVITSAILYLCCLANLYLISGAMLTGKVRRLTKSILRMLAIESSNSMQISYSIELWRRHLLSEEETVESYGSSIFGLTMSYGRILQFNVYFSYLIMQVFISKSNNNST